MSAPLGLLPEQILATVLTPADAALIDPWGRPHPLESRTMIGRVVERTGLMTLEGSVSRHHAHLAEDRDRGTWTVPDLGSANGTFVNEQTLSEATVLQHGDRIGLGQTTSTSCSTPAGCRRCRSIRRPSPRCSRSTGCTRRIEEEGHQPSQVRGFVRSSELLGALSWDTKDPTDNHLTQLIRRVRRTLVRVGIGDLLESRYRFGYRLRVVPRRPE